MFPCLSPSPAERERVGVGATVAKVPSAPLPTSPRSLREQGEETRGATLELFSNI